MNSPKRSSFKSLIVAAFLCFGLASFPSLAQEAQTFDAANLLYEQGDYAQAAAAFQTLIEQGQSSAATHFNLGNSLYQLGRTGEALREYHTALALSPRDPDVQANIQFTREKLGTETAIPRSFWQQFLLQITLNEWTLIALIPYWIWLTSAASLSLFPNRPAWLPGLTKFMCLCCLGMGLLLLGAANERLKKRYAVIVSDEAVVRFGPFEESKSSHNLVDGIEVQLLDQKDDWYQIKDPKGQLGWLKGDQITALPALP